MFARDRFARQTFDCGAFSVFVPAGARLSTTNDVHVFFSPGDVSGARGSNAVLVHGLRGAAAGGKWIVVSVPGVVGGATPITEAQILDCLRRVGLAGRIDRLRLSAHSRGNGGMALTLRRRLLTTAIERVTILDSSDFARSLIAGFAASRIGAARITSYDVNTGRFPLPGIENRHLDPLCIRSIGYARLIADAVSTGRLTTVPPRIDALVRALRLPPRGTLTSAAPPAPGKTPIRAFCTDPTRAAALRDLRSDERVGNIATYGARADTSPYAFIEFNNVMAFNDPSIPKSRWTAFVPGIYSHHLFVAEIAHELFP